ncbi:MAG: phosphotransferase [Thermoanaerobaculaceae bacterium]
MSVLDRAPRFSADDAERVARERWGIVASASPLPSERDQNVLLETPAGGRFVLKIANAAEDPALLEAQGLAMERLAATGLSPRLVRSLAGRDIETVTAPSGESHLVRLVTYLPGTPIGNVRRRTPGLLEEVGRCVGCGRRRAPGARAPGTPARLSLGPGARARGRARTAAARGGRRAGADDP